MTETLTERIEALLSELHRNRDAAVLIGVVTMCALLECWMIWGM